MFAVNPTNTFDTFDISERFLGLIPYDTGLSALARVRAELADGAKSAVLLGLEHEPVITLGVRGRIETDLCVTAEELRLKGVQLREIGRGGQATLHAPGQLVIYPCVNLRAFSLGARRFVEIVQHTTEAWLKNLGVNATASGEEPGLFVDGAKVAAFGFKIERGLTSHGLAINVSNDLAGFSLIRTCGISAQPVAKLVDFGVTSDLSTLFSTWALLFRANLEAETAQFRPKLDDGTPAPLV